MPWACGNCGQETSRGSSTFDHKGVRVREECPHCAPQKFDDPFRAPSDNKIFTGPEAMPKLYKLGADDIYHAKDELISDTVAAWDKGPTERAKERKRQTRRTEPLSASEIEATKRWGDTVLAPAIREQREKMTEG